MSDKITLRIEENPVIVKMSQEGPRGPQGIQGIQGNGIASIVKSATSGNTDTYTITLTDGTTSTFTVTNGTDGIMAATYSAEEEGVTFSTDYTANLTRVSNNAGGYTVIIG